MEGSKLDSALKRVRIIAGKTVTEVSEYLTSLGFKASEKTVYSWEAGRSRPTIDIFLEMCRFYGVTDIFSYFGDAPIVKKNSPSADEAAPGEVLSIIAEQFGADAQKAFSMYAQLDRDDQGEIRGEMKQMLKADKYKNSRSEGETAKAV